MPDVVIPDANSFTRGEEIRRGSTFVLDYRSSGVCAAGTPVPRGNGNLGLGTRPDLISAS